LPRWSLEILGRGRCYRSGRSSDRARLLADTRAQFGQTVSTRAPDSLNLTRSISNRSRQFGQISSNTSLPVIAPLHTQERRLVGETTSGWIGSLSLPDRIFAQRFAIRKSAFPASMPSGNVVRGGDGEIADNVLAQVRGDVGDAQRDRLSRCRPPFSAASLIVLTSPAISASSAS
jgi:hypothetical protein